MIESKEDIKNKSVATKLTVADQEEINKLIDAGLFLNNADFIRQAIKDKIDEYKIINIRNIPKKQAKKEIKKYMEVHDIAYVSQIAERLELDLDLVFDLVNELEKEEEIEATGN
jgi:Arc/MetJ-type ribon-helix-helix transcriptional regulator